MSHLFLVIEEAIGCYLFSCIFHANEFNANSDYSKQTPEGCNGCLWQRSFVVKRYKVAANNLFCANHRQVGWLADKSKQNANCVLLLYACKYLLTSSVVPVSLQGHLWQRG